MSLLKVNEVQNYNGSSLTLTASTVSTSAQLNTGGNVSVTGSINVSDDSTTRSNLGLGSIATQDSSNVSVTGGSITGTTIVPTSPFSFRNLLINGAAQISQRGDVTGITSTTYGGPDRFQHIMGSAGTFSISQSTDAPDGFSNSIKIACTSSTSLSTGNIYLVGQKIEGQNVQHLEYGSSTAKSLTFSFWVKTNVAGDYAVEFFSQTANRQISKSFNISSAEASAFSWVKRTMTIPGDTVTALPNNNTAEHAFYIWLCAGTDYTSGTLNSSAWASNTNANRALAMNLGSSTSNEFYLTGTQLEIGSVATPFEHRPYGVELSLCQRYFEKSYNLDVAPGTSTLTGAFWTDLNGLSPTNIGMTVFYKTQKRTAASPTIYAPDGTAGRLGNSLTPNNASGATVHIASEHSFCVGNNTTATSAIIGHFICNAEL